MKGSARNPNITVKLLDKQYIIACPEGAETELHDAADYLNNKMAEIRNAGKTIGLERIAIMAALNISYELQKSRRDSTQEISQRLQQLGEKIGNALPTDKHANDTPSSE